MSTNNDDNLSASRQGALHNDHDPTTTADRVRLEARLRELAMPFVTHEHPPVFTVAESDDLHRAIPGAHTKNLFLKDAKGRLFLIIADHRTDVALKKLHKRLGAARFSFGNADQLSEVLGVKPGSVTAFAVMNDQDAKVTAVFDQRLMEEQTINAHPLQNDATTSIARDDLLRFLSHHGHEPVIIALDDTGDDAQARCPDMTLRHDAETRRRQSLVANALPGPSRNTAHAQHAIGSDRPRGMTPLGWHDT